MELAGGVLRWPEAQFWGSTPHYLYAALDGFAESRGAKRRKPNTSDLREMMDAAPYRARSVKGHPKAIVIGGGRRGR